MKTEDVSKAVTLAGGASADRASAGALSSLNRLASSLESQS
jgi:hypothetical protein